MNESGYLKESHMSYMSKFVAALVGLLFLGLVASWEIFSFVVIRDPSGLTTAEGRSHLSLAAFAGITACVAGGLMVYFLSRHKKDKWAKVDRSLTDRLLTASALSTSNSPNRPFDAKRWALANFWLAEGQADDRMPMDGSVADSGETPSGQRASARRTHQFMFKKWSQARHE
jgi:hypothetical protein